MSRQNYVSILQQLLEKLQQKSEKEQQKLKQIKAIKDPLKLLYQEQQICLIQTMMQLSNLFI